MRKKIVAVLVVLVFISAFFWMRNRTQSPPPPPVVVLDEKDAVETMRYKYTSYSQKSFAGAAGKRKRVYFFSLSTCVTCKTAHQEFLNNPNGIPAGVVVFIINMESEKDLAEKYNVSAPHTFVQVDEDDEVVNTWTGGDIAALMEHLK